MNSLVSSFVGPTEPLLTLCRLHCFSCSSSLDQARGGKSPSLGCLEIELTAVATLTFFCTIWPWLTKAEKQAVFCLSTAQINLSLMKSHVVGPLRPQSPPRLTLHSPKYFLPILLFFPLLHISGSCFSIFVMFLHLCIKNLTLCGKNMGFIPDEEVGEESYPSDAGAGVL